MTEAQMMEQAEFEVYDRLAAMGLDTEEISDTATVEEMIERGTPLADIAAGKFPNHVVGDAVIWI